MSLLQIERANERALSNQQESLHPRRNQIPLHSAADKGYKSKCNFNFSRLYLSEWRQTRDAPLGTKRRLITRHKQSFSSEYSFMQHGGGRKRASLGKAGCAAQDEARELSLPASIRRRRVWEEEIARSQRRLQGKYWFQAAVTCNYPLPPPLCCCICLFAATISLFPPASGRIWNYCSGAKHTPMLQSAFLYFFSFFLSLRIANCNWH